MNISAKSVSQRAFLRHVIVILIACMFIGACSSSRELAPVKDFSPPPDTRIKYHIVARGETLYSIAWRYDLDYKQLAQANGVSSSFTIYPGQRLSLDLSKWSKQASKKNKKNKHVTRPSRPTKPANAPVAVRTPSARSEKETGASVNVAKSSRIVNTGVWKWPVKGKSYSRVNSKNGLRRGIEIKGKLGEPVYAAAAGRVVYSGSGLRGYGKLLIVKHNEKFLSAYAHNRRLLVNENDDVSEGQKIAEMGSTGTDTVKLYFEIRDDGKPVDPLKYLKGK